ncbi:bifunctional 3'-5' exonuclease/DNA polymerase [Actinoallomurus soli]|uniref:bifunctional 3'-5' exonuclease/DNA polymerase n=1 Tax=Actinoallomurus soli TaxID=2952535 RepID=UPI0020925431|nr:bifunctional 3'-5' exonuclease/DNA polymerase [Actinoallomurus soli]MCO5970490.1 bifunctional 3'-5' exonuclease/DNA polymerase [Actinoallomurus soli]
MRIAVGAVGEGGVLRPVADDGTPAGPAEPVADLVAAIARREAMASRPGGARGDAAGDDVASRRGGDVPARPGGDAPERPGPTRGDAASPPAGIRWVWPSTAGLYPRLLRAGVRVARCHDLELTETLLLGHAGRFGEPRSVAAALARLRGDPVPEDPVAAGDLPTLFDEGPSDDIDAVVAVHAEQQRRVAETGLRMLAAAESAGALAAAEMGHDGLPWRADVHDALLTGLMGPRPAPGLRPRELQRLADLIGEALGRRINPDSPSQIVKAFAQAGVQISSTRSHVLRQVEHPAARLLLEYKELARLYVAHGWSWADTWVRDGRFRPEYVVGGVVSGRWATNGGGALQIPKVLRRAVVADPGWRLVVADAAQLEPRVLAALAGDQAFAAAAGENDLYSALAGVFGGARDKAKIALLSAMYGGTSGEAPQLLAVMRRRFPAAYDYVEAAARAGEAGRVVRSRLGRTCPPPSPEWRDLAVQDGGGSAVRSRGRFTRNFVVQASAADWALVLLAALRRRLTALGSGGTAPRLVFFQHDEVIVHAPRELAEAVITAIRDSAAEARRLVFGDTPVRFPMEAVAVECYADAK